MSGKGGIVVLDKTNLFLKADWPWEGLIPDPGVQSCCIPRDLPAGGKQLPWNISCEWMDLFPVSGWIYPAICRGLSPHADTKTLDPVPGIQQGEITEAGAAISSWAFMILG